MHQLWRLPHFCIHSGKSIVVPFVPISLKYEPKVLKFNQRSLMCEKLILNFMEILQKGGHSIIAIWFIFRIENPLELSLRVAMLAVAFSARDMKVKALSSRKTEWTREGLQTT